MKGSRMWDMPDDDAGRRPDQVSGSEMTPSSQESRLMIPVSRRMTCQANVRTSRLDQNGNEHGDQQEAGDRPGTTVIRYANG